MGRERRSEQPAVDFAEASQVAFLTQHARDGPSSRSFRDWLSSFALGFKRSVSVSDLDGGGELLAGGGASGVRALWLSDSRESDRFIGERRVAVRGELHALTASWGGSVDLGLGGPP